MVQDGIKTAYAYDALGQLIRVDDGQENATWLYTYDNGGNIRSKQKFALGVTTGEPLESKHFSYSNDAWRDQLTAVDGVAITYDAIGNPLSDGTWSYTWQNGRQLQKMQKQGETVEFVYNENGLRVQKTATSTGVTKYTLHGKNVVHMTSGTDELHFFYDAQNRPAVVVYNGTAYAYVKSLQGDTVAILDENGNAVVSYGYDAWGAPLWCTGELAETLGKVQPFRYRGYVFDEETGLYYLRSRYYNAQWGRFVNADSILTKNLFAYCSSSPVNNKDAKGTSTTSANFSMALCDSEAGGCRTKVSRPQRLEFDSMTAPATLNLYRDFGLRDDVDMPLLNETRYVTVMNNQEAKVISETLLKNKDDTMFVIGIFWVAVGTLIPSAELSAIVSYASTIGMNIYSSGFESTYVMSGQYSTTIAIYDASAIESELLYVLIRTAGEDGSALNTDWNAFGVKQSELNIDQILSEELFLYYLE